MQTSGINHAIAAAAAQHHGLIHLGLAQQLQITRDQLHDRVANGMLVAVDRGVYRVAGAPVTWRQALLAACWSQGADAVASHRSAIVLWGLDGAGGTPLEVTAPRWDRRAARPAVRVHESKDLVPGDVTVVRGVPCTSVARTVIDAPAVLDEHRADQVFEDAVRQRLCTVEEVANRFVQVARRGRNGTQVGRRLIEKRYGNSVPTMSEFERRVASLVEGEGLPVLVRQHPVVLPTTTVFIDLAWPDRMIGIECDGLAYHGGTRLPWDDDRQNELTLRGWFILRITWEMVATRPEQILRQVREARSLRQPRPASRIA